MTGFLGALIRSNQIAGANAEREIIRLGLRSQTDDEILICSRRMELNRCRPTISMRDRHPDASYPFRVVPEV